MPIRRLLSLFGGIFLYALGIILSINASLGVAPWDAFHLGLVHQLGITLGVASMGVGVMILIFNYFIGEKIGFGTVVNIFGIGLIIDWLFRLNWIPTMNTFWGGLAMITLSMFTIALASYFYIGAGFGAGPRDGLMVGLVKKTGKKVGLVRGVIELTALFIGFLLGGKVGLGTVILGLGIGPIIQMTFKALRFDVSKVKHDYFTFQKTTQKN